jgi:hypothetical protein
MLKKQGDLIMSTTSLEHTLYIEKRTAQFDWIEAMLHEIWKRGLIFIYYRYVPATWEEQLDRKLPEQQRSLRDYIHSIVENGYGFIPACDRSSLITINFDPQATKFADAHNMTLPIEQYLTSDEVPYGSLSLYVHWVGRDVPNLPIPLEPPFHSSGYLIPPGYQAIYSASYWASLFCEVINPLYGVGYLEPDSRDVDEDLFFDRFELTLMQAIQSGQLPSLYDWLKESVMQYADVRFVTPEVIREWATHKDHSIRILSNGGLFSSSLFDPYPVMVIDDYRERAEEFQADRKALWEKYLEIRATFV